MENGRGGGVRVSLRVVNQCLLEGTEIRPQCRILEFRQMVMALHQAGWRVVLDVVYNHTFRAGPHDRCVAGGGGERRQTPHVWGVRGDPLDPFLSTPQIQRIGQNRPRVLSPADGGRGGVPLNMLQQHCHGKRHVREAGHR